MNFLFLTRTVGNIPVISIVYSWLVDLMGMIMSFIFEICSRFGVFNIGVCIILFTIVTRILMFPLSYNQSKSQKLMSAVQPEIMAIQKKYQGKTDQKSAMMMQAETKAVYEKYGVSMTGGCLQMFIQMPIIFALYKVILNIPAYVDAVKIYFETIVNAIGGAGAIEAVNTFAHSSDELTKVITSARIAGGQILTTDNIIDFLYHLNPAQWESFRQLFSSAGSVIAENYAHIEQLNSFLGINLASSPMSYGLLSPKAWIIPVLAGLSQFISSKLISGMSNNNQAVSDEENPTAATMKSMTYMMPLISVFFCFSFASGIGIYWIASSALMGLQQFFLNKHFNKMDTEALIKANIEKANAKRAKKGLPPINEKSTEENLRRMQEKNEKLQAALEAKEAASKKRIESNDQYYQSSSIADRANMVQQYENRKSKKK